MDIIRGSRVVYLEDNEKMTAEQWKVTIGAILLILFIIGILAIASFFDSKSRRERGLPPKKEKKNHRHEK